MEQRPENPSPVVLGAGTDPTHIPGLDTLEPDAPETAVADPGEPAEPAPDAADGEVGRDGPAPDEDEEAPPPEGPEFEVADHRGSIVANGNGVTFTLDDTEARWVWSEIGSVEIGASRFGRRFEVAVGTTDHRRFDAEVQASSKQQIEEWTAELDAVLDAWFDGGA